MKPNLCSGPAQARPDGSWQLKVRAVFALWLVAGGAVVPWVPTFAQSVGGLDSRASADECCLVLLLPVGARGIALGRAMTVDASPDAVFNNPAGLAGLESGYFGAHHTNVAAEVSAFSLLFPVGGVGTLGVSYELVDLGEIELTDENRQTIGTLIPRHHVLIGSFGAILARGFSAGVNYKLYQLRIGCRGTCGGGEITATTHAVDLGLRLQPTWVSGLEFGVAVSNMGFPLQVINAKQADPLPVRVRLGVAYEVLQHVHRLEGIELWWGLEAVDAWDDFGSPTPSMGVELAARDVLFLRAGYVPGDGVGTGASIGFGIRYERFTIALARSFVSSPLEISDEPVQFSFGLAF